MANTDFDPDAYLNSPQAPEAQAPKATDAFDPDKYLAAAPKPGGPTAYDRIADVGKDFRIGFDTAAADFRELAGYIPAVGPAVVQGVDAIDRYFHPEVKDSGDLIKKSTAATRASQTPETQAAAAKKWWDQDKGWFGDAWTDWRSYSSGLVQSLPEQAITMGPAMLLAKSTYASKIAAGAVPDIAAKAASRVAMVAGGLMEGLLGGAQSSREVRDEVSELKDDVINQSEAYRELLKSGLSPEAAKTALADDLATRAFVTAGVATGMFGGMGDRALVKIFTEQVGKGTLRKTLGNIGKGALSEGVFEELPQSVGQQLAQNEAVRKANPNKSLMDDVINQGLGGMTLGALQGSGMAAISNAAGRSRSEQQEPTPAPSPTKEADELRNILGEPPAGGPSGEPPAPPATSAAAPVDQRSILGEERPDESRPDSEYYVGEAMRNLRATSRTARGVLDLSSTPGKEDQMTGVSAKDAATLAQENFEGVIRGLYDRVDEIPKDGPDMAAFIDGTAESVNQGIVKPGKIIREHDTKIPAQTAAADLTAAHTQFSQELAERLADQNADPVETAAWIEWRANIIDHFWSDGVGKTSKALAAIPLMRAGLPLPNYPSSKEFSSYSPTERVDLNGGGEAYLGPAWERFNAFYHTLVDKPEPQQRAELKSMLENADTPLDGIINHPMVRRARDINQAAVASGTAENFADPEWRQQRFYDFGGERVQGWDAAVDRLTDGARAFSTAEPVAQDYHAVIVLGPPAAGKSTVSEPLARSLRAAIVDPDEAKKVIPEYRNGLGSHASHEESSELAKGVFKNLARHGSNIILPKVGHSYESIKGLVDLLKTLGYRVDIAHVAATPEISHRRNITRFLETGRLVDPNHITNVGDKPRNTAYMLKGDANDFLDASTSKGFEIIEGSGPLADAVRARRNVGWSPDTGRAGTPEGTGRGGAQQNLIGEPIPGMQAHRVTDADGRTIEVAPVVVEAGSLRTSRDYGYDQDLQPRDRDRAASDAQIREIASKLDPDRLGYSSEADRGSPIVGSDRMVESGNGRVIALRNVYDKGAPQAHAYRDWLRGQGVNVDAYQHPVLVRQRLTLLTPKERQAFTLAANRPATLGMSAPERAVADARLMDAKMLGLIRSPDDLGSVANNAFFRRFLSMLPKSEHGTLADSKGHLSAEGLTRARNAILAKAYGDTGVLARIAESTDDEVKSISNALTAAAPAWAAMRADVESGRVRADIDVTADLVRAVERTAEIRGRGEKLDAFLAQQDAFDRMPAEVEGFMRMFYDPRGRRAASAKRITDALRFYADEASKVSAEKGLGLELVPVAPQDIQRLAFEREWQGEQYGIQKSGRGAGDGADNAAGSREARGPWLGQGREVAAQRGDESDSVEETIRAQQPTLEELRARSGVVEKTKAGDQFVFPGGERISTAELARRRAAEPIRPRKEQRPADFGLFGETSQQGDLLAPQPKGLKPVAVATTVSGGTENSDGRAGVQPGTPAVPGRTQARRLAKTPASRPPELPLFGWEPSERPVRHPDEAVRPESGGQGPAVPTKGPGVTKPPTRGGRTGSGRTDLPAVKGRLEAERKIAERSRSNYRITPEDQIGVGNARQKINGNIEAIRTLRIIQDESRFATPAEKAVLVKYVGWGAFAQDMFSAHKPEWKSERDAFRALVSDEEYNAARESTLNAHFTSPDVIRGMWDAMDHLGFKGGQAIEPAAGIGHFIGLIPDKVASKTAWTAIELDRLTGSIAKALYGGTDVGIHGFEDLKRPSNYYDLAVSNVPFGQYHISEKPYGSFPIHDFFFVKSLDKVRPGGVVAFITSRYTMDRVDPGTRRLLGQSADLVGAIRLPGGRKGAFSGNAGTEVTTDIIFLRKKVPGEPAFPGANWTDVKEVQTPEGPVNVNEYFADRPDMMLGEMRLQGSMYRANEQILVGDADGLQERIAAAARKMPKGALLPMDSPPPPPISGDEIGAGIKDGSFFIQNGKLYQRRQGQGFEHPLNQDDHDSVVRLVGMRGIINDLLQTQLDSGENAKATADHHRAMLRAAYDDFVAKHGPINKEDRVVTNRLDKEGEPIVLVRTPNFTPFKKDPDAWKVAAIEDYDSETGKAKRAAIQTKNVIDPPRERQINGPSDALSASLNDTAGVDLDHIAQSLNLPSHDAAIQALGNLVYQNPDGRKFETADEYLAGNVVKKLEDARALAEQDPSYLRNVAALEKVQPEPLTGTDITAQFGAPWIPESVYQDFLSEIGIRNPRVARVPITGEWRFDYGSATHDAQIKYGTGRVDVGKIANAALNGKMVTVYDRDGDKVVVNDTATQEARVKTDLLKEAFTGDIEHGIDGWVFADPDRAQLLEGIYNRTYNNLAQRQFDGSHLTLPGLNPDFATRKHRKDAIWRIIQTGNTLLAHVVGSGKTLTMIAAGMEEKRLGLINKPAYVVPNHLLEQFSREFIQGYPNAKILVAQKDEMTRENRKEFLAKVSANDWDGVIITQDAFGRINMGQEFRKSFIQDQLDELERVMKAEAAGGDKKSQTVKNLEKAKKKLQERLQNLMNEDRKDEGTSFEESGIDRIYGDEFHRYKNLQFVSRMNNIAGLAQGNSQRAEDMFLKVRYLEQKRPGRSLVAATGTPVSNTMAELWTMMRYLELDKLRERGLETFDAWASTFGRVVNNMELSADGRTFKERASFSKFVNIPELVALYAEVADTKTADMLNLPRPEVKTRSGAPGIEIVEATPSSQEEAHIDALVKLAESLKGKPPKKGEPNMLSVVTAGRKVATDGRLIGSDFDFNPQGKIAKAVDNITRIYREGNEDPAAPNKVQMVFLDMGVPQSRGAKKPRVVEGEESVGPTQQDRIDLYADLKQRLIDKGIPAREIAAIHDAGDDIKKAKLFKRVRSGEVRVILGSSEKMGVGTNVQDLLIAMHHLDAPWKPADVEQRDGRIVRQGNKNKNVQIYRYVTKKSFDAFMWQKLDTKSRFIGQVLSGAKGSRHAEDIDNPLPEAAEMKAAASGDPRIMEHAELDRIVRALSAQKRAFDSTKSRAHSGVAQAKSRIEMYEKALPNAKADAADVQDIAGDKFVVELGDAGTFTNRAEAGKAILQQMPGMDTPSLYRPTVLVIGQMSGFTMNMEVRGGWDGTQAVLRATPSLKGKSGYGAVNDTVINEYTDPAGLIRRFENILGNIKANPARLTGELANERESLGKLQRTLSGEWPREKEYRAALKKLDDLSKSMKAPEHPDVTEAENAEVKAQRPSQERKDFLTFKGKPVWAVVVDPIDNAILHGVTYKHAALNDFHHNFYLPERYASMVSDGDAILAWADDSGVHAMETLPPQMRAAVEQHYDEPERALAPSVQRIVTEVANKERLSRWGKTAMEWGINSLITHGSQMHGSYLDNHIAEAVSMAVHRFRDVAGVSALQMHDMMSKVVGRLFQNEKAPAGRKTGPQSGDRVIKVGRATEAYVRDRYTKAEQKIAAVVEEIGTRMAPQANVKVAAALRMNGHAIWGFFVNSAAFPHLIAWSLEKGDAPAIAGSMRHEIVHHLREAGLIRPEEWKALSEAATKGGWLKKHKIDERYPTSSMDVKIEEAVAEEFAYWRTDRAVIKTIKGPLQRFIRDAFNRIDLLLRRIAAAARQYMGRDATASDIFTRMETGEVGHREKRINGRGQIASVDSSYDVKSGAVASKKDAGLVFIDRHIPRFSPKLKDRDGNPAQLWKYLSVHETEERKAMAKGMPYEAAHEKIATPAERAAVEADGVDWKAYTHEIDGYLATIEHERVKNPPPGPHVDPTAAVNGKPHHHSVNKAQAPERDDDGFPVVRTPEELAKQVAAMRPRSNKWISVPEGEIYIRIGQRPDIGSTLEIPNIEFREDARGTGAFTKYLSALEHTAAARNLDAVYVEQLFNKRLESFLRRRGYRDVPNFGSPDQATLYKRVDDDVKAQTPGRDARERRQAAGTPATTIWQRVVQSSDRFRAAADAYADSIGVNEILRGLQMKIAPMASRDASVEARVITKKYGNARRQSRHDWNNADKFIMDHFPADRRKAMWEAADEQSVAMQQGLPTAGIGLDLLPANERAVVQMLQDRGQRNFDEARRLKMVQTDGLPSYAPRMLVRMTGDKAEVGAGAGSEIVKDIRTLALANARLEDAIAGRKLINEIEDVGRRTGSATVNTGGPPSPNSIGAAGLVAHALDQIGVDFAKTTPQLKHRKHLTAAETEAAANLVRTPDPDAPKWFTLNNPAFFKLAPRLRLNETTGKVEVVKDSNGDPIFDQKPIYVRSDFEGPLRAVLSKDSDKLYQALMNLKGKAMSVIMMSPLIHNQVEWGRALPAAPGKVLTFQVYVEGNRADHDPALMRKAIAGGTSPIGGHGFMQDLVSIAEAPTVRPGRSWTAKGAGYAVEATGHITRLFDPRARADDVRRAVDYMGNFWHNTLLWDRIRDLQMGLWSHINESLVAKGYNPYAANVAASHFANRYAGALPLEAMSGGARAIANILLFSRTFTLGNLGAFKDAAIGLPRDAQAMIEHHAGWDELQKIQSFVKRKSKAMLAFDAGLYYVTLSLLQSAFNTAGVVPSVATLGGMIAGGALGGKGGKYGRIAAAVGGGAVAFGLAAVLGASPGTKKLEDELEGYWERFAELLRRNWEHPFELVIHPIDALESLSATADNEPGKKGRLLVGYQPDGTAIYARLAVGKVTEEFIGWGSSPLEMLHNKLSTFARPLNEIWSNDAGFGHKLYNPKANTYGEQAKNVMKIAAAIVGSQIPVDTIKGAKEWFEGGPGSDVAGLKSISPFIGTTISKGYPGGPELGVLNDARERQKFQVNEWMPTIRKQIRNGEVEKATEKMTELGIAPALQKFYIATTQNPKARLTRRQVQDFMRIATPEQKKEFEAAQRRGATENRYTGGAVLARAHGGRVEAANINHEPTEAQKHAGNYAKDHVHVFGLDLTIENAKGSVRRGVGADGKPWACALPAHYGYVKRSHGQDDDHVDVYLGPHTASPHVFVIDQHKLRTGEMDEHKAMLGFGSQKQALACYERAFSDGKGRARIGAVTTMTVPQFKEWLATESEKRTHASVGYVEMATDKDHCSICTHFIPGNPPACRGVKSPISPTGWCERFRKK